MRIAFISDVHSNRHALEAVLDDIDAGGIERIYCAGDIVGYGAFPNEVIDIFKRRGIESVAGNHDESALAASGRGMNSAAAAAVLWTARKLNNGSLAYLKELDLRKDFTLGGRRVCLCHGSPRDKLEYVYEEDAEPEMLWSCEANLLILGHTHVPFVKTVDLGTIANPGSVGQPRDGDPRASYLVLDATKCTYDQRRIGYDIEGAASSIVNAGLPNYLGDRLRRGI
jgi:putative phosphoesterase